MTTMHIGVVFCDEACSSMFFEGLRRAADASLWHGKQKMFITECDSVSNSLKIKLSPCDPRPLEIEFVESTLGSALELENDFSREPTCDHYVITCQASSFKDHRREIGRLRGELSRHCGVTLFLTKLEDVLQICGGDSFLQQAVEVYSIFGGYGDSVFREPYSKYDYWLSDFCDGQYFTLCSIGGYGKMFLPKDLVCDWGSDSVGYQDLLSMIIACILSPMGYSITNLPRYLSLDTDKQEINIKSKNKHIAMSNKLKTIRVAVVGEASNGKTFFIDDMLQSTRLQGYDADHSTVNNCASVAGFRIFANNKKNGMEGTEAYVGSKESHFGIVRKNINDSAYALEFMDIPGEFLNDKIATIYVSLFEELTQIGKCFTVVNYKHKAGGPDKKVVFWGGALTLDDVENKIKAFINDEATKKREELKKTDIPQDKIEELVANYKPNPPDPNLGRSKNYDSYRTILKNYEVRKPNNILCRKVLKHVGWKTIVNDITEYDSGSIFWALLDAMKNGVLTKTQGIIEQTEHTLRPDNPLPPKEAAYEYLKSYYFYCFILNSTDVVYCVKSLCPKPDANADRQSTDHEGTTHAQNIQGNDPTSNGGSNNVQDGNNNGGFIGALRYFIENQEIREGIPCQYLAVKGIDTYIDKDQFKQDGVTYTREYNDHNDPLQKSAEPSLRIYDSYSKLFSKMVREEDTELPKQFFSSPLGPERESLRSCLSQFDPHDWIRHIYYVASPIDRSFRIDSFIPGGAKIEGSSNDVNNRLCFGMIPLMNEMLHNHGISDTGEYESTDAEQEIW